jgi:cytochrome c oxidase assembly protein subunit 11
MTSTPDPSKNRIKKQTRTMVFIVVGMFGFCFLLVPLYSVFCKVTGLNGKTAGQIVAAPMKIDYSRTVTVELLSTINEFFPSEFAAKDKKITLHPGEYVTTSYWVKNLTAQPMVVQAIPSVTPGIAARHVHKIECFCFQKQPMNPLEGKDMALKFTVSPELPHHINTITLAYTLFDVTHS